MLHGRLLFNTEKPIHIIPFQKHQQQNSTTATTETWQQSHHHADHNANIDDNDSVCSSIHLVLVFLLSTRPCRGDV
jgi:hypothetical protein